MPSIESVLIRDRSALVKGTLSLCSDGQKMSKRLKNYPDPVNVVNKFGTDALHLYLVNSPMVRAEALKFKESGVKDVFLPWFNAYRFLMQNVERLKEMWLDHCQA